MTDFDGVMHDADNHYYEPDDCFTRHIEPEYRDKTVWLDRQEPGTPARMYVGDERCWFFSVGTGDSVGPPGIMKDFLRGTSNEGGSPSLNPIDALPLPLQAEDTAEAAQVAVAAARELGL